MKDKTRERVALGLGLMAGAALGYFLNSDKGRAVRKDANEKMVQFGEEASVRISHLTDEAKVKAQAFSETITHAVDEGKEYLTHVGENLKKKFSKAEESIENASEDFKAGMKYALRNIQKKAKELESTNVNGN
ncbi:MAG: YtxH domain-containing protein [Phaeodactylibacter sp.]|nr:YtxH domain-containing protein [Phaeodactylibacter sp.]MCB9276873.1 YtxH domain-containing protein [Lewinellaceae bacterium]